VDLEESKAGIEETEFYEIIASESDQQKIIELSNEDPV
jgi:hypothetical protein